jgi:hypothetical protein
MLDKQLNNSDQQNHFADDKREFFRGLLPLAFLLRRNGLADGRAQVQ